MADTNTNSYSFTSFESTSDILNTIVDDGGCPSHLDESINVFCYTDKSFMCLKCSIQHKGHHITAFDSLDDARDIIKEVNSTLFCSKHKEKTCQFYCEVESRPVCETCCIVSCKNHDISEINDLYQECKQELDALHSQVSTVNDSTRVQSILKATGNIIEQLEQKRQKDLTKVETDIDELVKKLTTRKQELITETNNHYNDNIEEIRQSVSRFEQISDWDSFYRKLMSENKYETVKYCKGESLKALRNEISKAANMAEESAEAEEDLEDLQQKVQEQFAMSGLKVSCQEPEKIVSCSYRKLILPISNNTGVKLLCHVPSNKPGELVVYDGVKEKTTTHKWDMTQNGSSWMIDDDSVAFYHGEITASGFGFGATPAYNPGILDIYSLSAKKIKQSKKFDSVFVPGGLMNHDRTKLYLFNATRFDVWDVVSMEKQEPISLPGANTNQFQFGGVVWGLMKVGKSECLVSCSFIPENAPGTMGFGGFGATTSLTPKISVYNFGPDEGEYKHKEWTTVSCSSFSGNPNGGGRLVQIDDHRIMVMPTEYEFPGTNTASAFGAQPTQAIILDLKEKKSHTKLDSFDGANIKIKMISFVDSIDCDKHIFVGSDAGNLFKIDKESFKIEKLK